MLYYDFLLLYTLVKLKGRGARVWAPDFLLSNQFKKYISLQFMYGRS
jgi:hypothetical protein